MNGIDFSFGMLCVCVGSDMLIKCCFMKVDSLVLKIDKVRFVVIWLVMSISVSYVKRVVIIMLVIVLVVKFSSGICVW